MFHDLHWRKLISHCFLAGIILASLHTASAQGDHPESDPNAMHQGGLADLSGVGTHPDHWFHALESAQQLAEVGVGYEAARVIAAIADKEEAGPARQEAQDWLEESGLSVDFIREASQQEIQSRLLSRAHHGHGLEILMAHVGNLIDLNRWAEAANLLRDDLAKGSMVQVQEKWLPVLENFQIPLNILDRPLDEAVVQEAFHKAHQRAQWRRRLPLLGKADREAMELAHFLIQHDSSSEAAFEGFEERPTHRWEEAEQEAEEGHENRPDVKEVASHAIQKIIALAEPHPEAARLLAEILITFFPDSLASPAAKSMLTNIKSPTPASLHRTLPPREVRETPEDAFWEPSVVRAYHLELSEAAIASLRKEPKEYVRGVLRENGNAYEDVGVRLKGGWGSFRMLDGRSKAAFTIKFNQFKSNQRFHGLRRIILNNAVQDPSYMRENIGYSLFRDAGIPAPRVTYATLTINEQPYGLYVQVEAVTKDFLKRWFDDTSGNLYEGPGDVIHWEELDLDSNQETADRSDLRHLSEAIEQADDVDPWNSLNNWVHAPSFARFLCLEQFMNHWDGYTQINNYRIYHDPESNQFHFFAHGADQVFEDLEQNIFRGQGGILGRALVMTEPGRTTYRQTARDLLKTIWNEERILERIAACYPLIRPHVVSHENENNHAIIEFEHVVHEMIRFVSMRRYALENQLADRTSHSWRDQRHHEEDMPFLWQD